MWPKRRALVFDLDDTLYPSRRYAESAAEVVARHLARRCGLERERTVAMLRRLLDRRSALGHEYDRLLSACGLPSTWLPEIVAVARAHEPNLRLPLAARRLLDAVRPSWALGIVTNGYPSVQALKVRALGLSNRVDVIVYAAEYGTGLGKPEPEAFCEVARRLQVDCAHVVFVGDDESRDVAGAAGVGMRTIRLTGWTRPLGFPVVRSEADAVVRSLAGVPAAAESLIGKATVHAA